MRLIDADAFRKVLSEWEMKYDRRRSFDDFAYGATSAYEHAGDLLDEMPTIKTFTLADIEEQYRKGLEKGLEDARPHGEWITTSNIWEDDDLSGWGYYKECSCCHNQERRRTPFCPNCGADLRKEGDEK